MPKPLPQAEPLVFSLYETILWTPAEGWTLFEEHLGRMLASAAFFGFPVAREAVLSLASSLEGGFTSPRRVRILLSPEGRLSSESTPFVAPKEGQALRARLAPSPVAASERLLYHKTTQRPWYDEAKKDLDGYDETLFYNIAGELTEFIAGNLLVEMQGEYFTPPVRCGLLPGTFRARLLAEGLARERALKTEDLADCGKVFFVNSVRGRRDVSLDLRS
jgi:branched-subunit amino acid aminotransferase/4-amino-4-deoxychorismate lyase